MSFDRQGREYDDTAMPDDVLALRQKEQGRLELGIALETPRGDTSRYRHVYTGAVDMSSHSAADPDSLRA